MLNKPIIYIDGIRMDNDEYYSLYAGGQGVSTLADLNPEDIAVFLEEVENYRKTIIQS